MFTQAHVVKGEVVDALIPSDYSIKNSTVVFFQKKYFFSFCLEIGKLTVAGILKYFSFIAVVWKNEMEMKGIHPC